MSTYAPLLIHWPAPEINLTTTGKRQAHAHAHPAHLMKQRIYYSGIEIRTMSSPRGIHDGLVMAVMTLTGLVVRVGVSAAQVYQKLNHQGRG